MANIKAYIDKIKSAIYGEEVRGSMVNALNALDTTLDEHIKNHPASDGSVSPEQIESAVGNYLTKNPIAETDPTVPQWAKNPTKPTYTAQEVGALPNSTHIPTQLSEMTEDATHRVVTDAEKQAWNSKSNFSGNYNDLTNKPTIPSKLSEMAGDVNNRTVTDAEKNAWNAKAEKSDIPSVANFATKTELGNKADKTEIANLATKAELQDKANQSELNLVKENLNGFVKSDNGTLNANKILKTDGTGKVVFGDMPQGGSGGSGNLNDTAIGLLSKILTAGVYTSNQSNNIVLFFDALRSESGGSGGGGGIITPTQLVFPNAVEWGRRPNDFGQWLTSGGYGYTEPIKLQKGTSYKVIYNFNNPPHIGLTIFGFRTLPKMETDVPANCRNLITCNPSGYLGEKYNHETTFNSGEFEYFIFGLDNLWTETTRNSFYSKVRIEVVA